MQVLHFKDDVTFFSRLGKEMVNFHWNMSNSVRALGPGDSFAEQTMFFIPCYSHLEFISWVISFYIHCILKNNCLGIISENLIKIQFVTQNTSEGNILESRAHVYCTLFCTYLLLCPTWTCHYFVIIMCTKFCYSASFPWLSGQKNGMDFSWKKFSWKITMAYKSRKVLAALQPFHSGLIISNNNSERR